MTLKPSSTRRPALRFGDDSQFELPLDDGDSARLLAFVGEPKGDPIDDPQQFVVEALDDPISFPPLVEATVPGDHIAIPVGSGIPQVASVLAGMIQSLTNGRVDAADIRVILPGSEPSEVVNIPNEVIGLLPTHVGNAITFECHDTSAHNQLCYLAASRDAKPIFFNRTICEADLVIPVGCLRPEGALAYVDDAMGLFPTFADEETIRDYSAPSSWLSSAQRENHRDRAREAAWLLGVTFTVQVLPGAGNALLRILAGEREAVFDAGRRLIDDIWVSRVPSRSSLVVAAIEGGPEQQTWRSVACALSAALRVVEDEGAIVVCSELEAPPGSTLLKIRGIDRESDVEFQQIERAVTKENGHDAFVAAQLVEALRRVRVYLYSQLEEDLVEDLGIAPVTRISEIANLCLRSESCILLANAQHAVPVLDSSST